jgi:energy-coupling factor transporter ATP-binding protein EcfA2
MSHLYPSAKAVKRSAEQSKGALSHTNHAFNVLQLFAISAFAGLAVGALVAWVSVRRMRAGFEWGLVWIAPLGVAIWLAFLGLLSGDVAVAAITALVAMLAGHLGVGLLLHVEDRRAGDDRGHESRERIGPHHLLRRARAQKRILSGKSSEIPIGITRRGRMASIPAGGESGSHTLIVGATGAGKSTLLGVLAHEHAQRGSGVVLVEAKNDPELEAQARRTAAAFGRPFILVGPEGPTVWDVLATGGVDETVAKLLACEEWSEPFYLAEATRFLRWVIRGMEDSDTRLTLPAVLGLCDPDQLAAHAAKHGSPELAGELNRFVNALTARERSDVAGLRSRLAVLAESGPGRDWLNPDSGAGPILDLSDAIRKRAVVYFRLDAERYGIVAEKIGAAIAIELGAIASQLQGRPIPTLVAIDEFGAIEAEQVERLFTRGRAAGISAVVATHAMSDLEVAGDGFEGRLKATVGSLLGLRMGPDDADAVARMAGQVGEWQSTTRTAGLLGMPAGAGTRTRGYRLRIHPSLLQHLGWSECAVIRLDCRDGDRAMIVRVIPSWERGDGSNGAGR